MTSFLSRSIATGLCVLLPIAPLAAATKTLVVAAKTSHTAVFTVVYDDQVWSASFGTIATQNNMDAFLVQAGQRPDSTPAAVLVNSQSNKRLYRDFEDFIAQDLALLNSQATIVSSQRRPLTLAQKPVRKALEIQIRFDDEFQRAVYIETDKAYISLVLSLTTTTTAWDGPFNQLLSDLYLD